MQILYFLLAISVFINIVLCSKVISINKKISESIEVLDDIKKGNGNRKILSKDNDNFSEIIYKINEIVYLYEEKLTEFRKMENANNQLLTSLSHDIRTPLTSIIGYTDAIKKELLKDGLNDKYDLQNAIENNNKLENNNVIENYIDIVREKSYSLKEYLDNVFDWFKLNSNEFYLDLKDTEITELSRNIIKSWIVIFEEKDIDFDIEIEEKEIICNLDQNAYARVINNIIQNAVEHSKTKKIQISIKESNRKIFITIKDFGVGIEPDDLEHIFDRLYKCDKARNKVGSGLGLYITKELVEKMNGCINVKSEVGEGTEFEITFEI
ncbi:sensor histidine kinase [Peptacetobacter hiranonis]|uniref:histidine kinase n=1 Tax=Peptacetobacter hiranonis (strain DSM 13275 / JCM 10541 / KCTC 15199 / TO-931) TaxID=500633 RepID=B6FXJ8_PEPHT|nr:HAMP domain-containing sensor histidine kinase [Peptacetobacter hiranonis]EEA85746.1 ATPase/histidine kinase/DNA gyrase B/HSP90 domain protein [Peptacetobacter hiranonis DSM 13275]QEK20636.1 Sensor histidine kinase ResE [Peptacetobacter hiranonis]